MYWLNSQTILGIALVSYFLGTLIGIYLVSVSVLGALVWLVVAAIVGGGSIFFAGRDWNKSKQK